MTAVEQDVWQMVDACVTESEHEGAEYTEVPTCDLRALLTTLQQEKAALQEALDTIEPQVRLMVERAEHVEREIAVCVCGHERAAHAANLRCYMGRCQCWNYEPVGTPEEPS